MVKSYLLHKDCQLTLFTTRAGENLSFLFVSIHLQAGESDVFSMVDLTPTGENTEVALLSCEFLPYAWIEAAREE